MTTAARRAARLMIIAALAMPLSGVADAAAPSPAIKDFKGSKDSKGLEAVADAYDAGRVEVGTKVTHTYELRNHGTRPLRLTVEPSCGCTTTSFDEVIPAGGSGTITAALETAQLRGRAVKSIRVTTDDRDQPSLTLTLAVEAVPIIAVKPAEQPVLTARVGALRPMEVTLSAPDGIPFEILRVQDDLLLKARLLPPDPAAGASAGKKTSSAARVSHRLTLTPTADLAIGTYMPVVTLATTRPKAEQFVLRPMIIVEAPIVATPLQLRLRSAAVPMTVRISAFKKGPPFRVLRAESSDADFTPQVIVVGSGRAAYDVTLRYTGSPERRGPVNAVLKVTTDEPLQPLLIVRFSGQL